MFGDYFDLLWVSFDMWMMIVMYFDGYLFQSEVFDEKMAFIVDLRLFKGFLFDEL